MTDQWETYDRLILAREEAERKAWDSLSRYKFYMFGYHAATWVKYNQLMPTTARLGNPFSELVRIAKGKVPIKVSKSVALGDID